MTCGACGSPNPEGMKFCGECGQALRAAAACPGCGFENPPVFKFCGECGASLRGAPETPDRAPRDYTPRHLAEKILRTRSALEGERKQVTVLFADVKGSLELAGRVDPEDWHRILDRFFAILTEGVHRFEGTVNQYTGDGIMALFGAPIAHEDHAQRACYAALHLRDELRRYSDELRLSQGFDFAVRMGIHSGEVVVGKIGDDLRMDYTAQGQTVGLAQRLEQLAAAQSVYLSEATAQLVSGYVELRQLGPATVKGQSEPIRVFERWDPGAGGRASTWRRAGGSRASWGATRTCAPSRRPWNRPPAARARWWAWSPRRVSERAASASSSSVAAAPAGSAWTRVAARRTEGRFPTSRCSSCCAACSELPSVTWTRRRGARSPTRCAASTRASSASSRSPSTSCACPTRSTRFRRWARTFAGARSWPCSGSW